MAISTFLPVCNRQGEAVVVITIYAKAKKKEKKGEEKSLHCLSFYDHTESADFL